MKLYSVIHNGIEIFASTVKSEAIEYAKKLKGNVRVVVNNKTIYINK